MASQKTKLWHREALLPEGLAPQEARRVGAPSTEVQRLEPIVRTKLMRFAVGELPSTDARGKASELPFAAAAPEGEQAGSAANLVSTRVMPIEQLFPELSRGRERSSAQESGDGNAPGSSDTAPDLAFLDRWAGLRRRLRGVGSSGWLRPALARAFARREARVAAGLVIMAILGGRVWTSRLQNHAVAAPGLPAEQASGVLEADGARLAQALFIDDGEEADALASAEHELAVYARAQESLRSAREQAPRRASPLARTAVDTLASGDLVAAADLYEKLASAEPARVAYAEAARILRARAGARHAQ